MSLHYLLGALRSLPNSDGRRVVDASAARSATPSVAPRVVPVPGSIASRPRRTHRRNLAALAS